MDDRRTYWWLSFADASRPTGTQFLGACVAPGDTMIEAVKRTHRAGINPGGEVAGLQISREDLAFITADEVLVMLDADGCKAFDRTVSARKAN